MKEKTDGERKGGEQRHKKGKQREEVKIKKNAKMEGRAKAKRV